MKPICFLDVDGVLNACPPLPEEEAECAFEALGFPICFPLGTAGRVARLSGAFEMVWLTTWEGRANEHMYERLLGEPGEWPAVPWRRQTSHKYGRLKLLGAKAWMEETGREGRPFAQIDDDSPWEQQELRRLGLDPGEEFPQPTLFLAPETRRGLTDEHVDAALEFAAGLEGGLR